MTPDEAIARIADDLRSEVYSANVVAVAVVYVTRDGDIIRRWSYADPARVALVVGVTLLNHDVVGRLATETSTGDHPPQPGSNGAVLTPDS